MTLPINNELSELKSLNGLIFQVLPTLLSNGADYAARDLFLWTPLDHSAYEGHWKCAEILLDVNETEILLNYLQKTIFYSRKQINLDKV